MFAMGTGKSAGIAGSNSDSALGPPVEVPMARISIPAMARGFVEAAEISFMGGGGAGITGELCETWGARHKALILGIKSSLIFSMVTPRPPVVVGFAT